MNVSQTGWRVAALCLATGFFWLATRVDFYHATTPYGLAHAVFGASTPNVPHPWWLALHIWVRKAYSIVAFAIVGLTVDRALGATSRPGLRAACIVGCYSAAIEFVQHAVDPAEPWLERAIDVGCGATGGYIGVLVLAAIGRFSARNVRLSQ